MSTKLTELLAADGSKIYIQYDEDESDELRAVADYENVQERTLKFKETMESTIRGYSEMVFNTVQTGMKDIPPPDKLTLEFGLQIGGEAGIPFVTKGTANANINVTVEWSLNKKTQQ